MKTKLLTLIFIGISSLSNADIHVSPDEPTRVTLSNSNPNRINCVSGLVNDRVTPSHIPADYKIVRDDMFVVYKMKPKQDGSIQYVTKSHDMHVVCDGRVYTISVRPRQTRGKIIYLGDPDIEAINQNANLIREEDIEDIMVDVFLDAYNDELPPNYTVKEETGSIRINDAIQVEYQRSITLNGVGIKLKEYLVKSKSTLNLNKHLFLKQELSENIRMVAVEPPRVTPDTTARLFIVESK